MQNNSFTFAPSTNEFKIFGNSLTVSLGYKQEDVPEAVNESLELLIPLALKTANIKCGFYIFGKNDINISKENISINKVTFNIEKIIAMHLKHADSIAIFAATIGDEFDKLINELKEKDILESFLVDTIGSELVEAVGDWLEIKLKNIVTNKNISNRLSPGYCGWKVSEQHKLFSLLPKQFCGISLNDSALMKPIKSISGVIGIGDKLKRLDYQCKICSLDHCYKRNRASK